MLKSLKIGLIGALALSAATMATAADMRLKLAGTFPVDHQGTKMLEQIKEDIEAADVGLKVSVFPANQLGSGEALMEDTINGNIDFTAGTSSLDNAANDFTGILRVQGGTLTASRLCASYQDCGRGAQLRAASARCSGLASGAMQ